MVTIKKQDITKTRTSNPERDHLAIIVKLIDWIVTDRSVENANIVATIVAVGAAVTMRGSAHIELIMLSVVKDLMQIIVIVVIIVEIAVGISTTVENIRSAMTTTTIDDHLGSIIAEILEKIVVAPAAVAAALQSPNVIAPTEERQAAKSNRRRSITICLTLATMVRDVTLKTRQKKKIDIGAEDLTASHRMRKICKIVKSIGVYPQSVVMPCNIIKNTD